jgi:hypothetical protein
VGFGWKKLTKNILPSVLIDRSRQEDVDAKSN